MAPRLGPKGDSRSRVVISVVFKTPEMHIPPWYWFRYPNSPFDIADWSVKEPFTGNWKAKVQERIKRTSVTVVICGHRTHTAQGVAAELQISRDLGKPYFLLIGRKDNRYTRPTTALRTDKVYDWSWRNLEALFAGRR